VSASTEEQRPASGRQFRTTLTTQKVREHRPPSLEPNSLEPNSQEPSRPEPNSQESNRSQASQTRSERKGISRRTQDHPASLLQRWQKVTSAQSQDREVIQYKGSFKNKYANVLAQYTRRVKKKTPSSSAVPESKWLLQI